MDLAITFHEVVRIARLAPSQPNVYVHEGVGVAKERMSKIDDWKIAEVTEEEGSVRFFMKNMAPAVRPADPEYPFLAYITFRYRDSDERGLPCGDEWRAVQEIERSAASQLEGDGIAIHVAEVLGGGVKDLLFYVRDLGAFAQRAALLLRRYAHLVPSIEITLDAEWSQYADFP